MDKLLSVFFGLTCLMLAVQGQVGTLNSTVTRNGCGTTKACFADPLDCDPETSSECLLATTKSASSNLQFELRGVSAGYIAVALSTDTTAGGNDKTYICTKDSTFVFALLNNDVLTEQSNSSISNVNFLVNASSINCAFEVSGLNSSRSAHTTFAVVLASGEVNADGTLANPTVRSVSGLVNLADPTSTNAPTNSTTNTTTAAPTTTTTTTTVTTAATTASGANINLQHTLSQALLILFGVLALGVL